MTTNLTTFQDFPEIKNRIIFRLGSSYVKDNTPNIVYRSYLNIYLYYYVFISRDDTHISTYKVTWEMLDYWKVNEEELFKLALLNTPVYFPVKVTRISKLLKEMEEACPNITDNIYDDFDPPYYVISNDDKSYGAGSTIFPGVASDLYKQFGSDYYIIPSSIHETIAVPVDSVDSKETIKMMIYEVNKTEVSDDEYLSGNLYYYNGKESKFSIC